jgi:LysM repeat protein
MAKARHARPSRMRTTAKAAAAAAPAGVVSLAIAAPAYAATPAHVQQANQVVPLSAIVHAVRVSPSSPSYMTVVPGNTLSGIAQQRCGTPSDWTGIYQANRHQISDPNEIYPGQHLALDCTQVSYQMQVRYDPVQVTAKADPPAALDVSSGVYSPSQLGALWLAAGGSPAAESTAECIAHFESGGRADALSPTDDEGLWQINVPAHPALATYDPMGNARAAVIISGDGTNWGPWTTAPDCGV